MCIRDRYSALGLVGGTVAKLVGPLEAGLAKRYLTDQMEKVDPEIEVAQADGSFDLGTD